MTRFEFSRLEVNERKDNPSLVLIFFPINCLSDDIAIVSRVIRTCEFEEKASFFGYHSENCDIFTRSLLLFVRSFLF